MLTREPLLIGFLVSALASLGACGSSVAPLGGNDAGHGAGVPDAMASDAGSGEILTQVKSITVGTPIWGVLSANNSTLNLTTMSGDDIILRNYDADLTQVGRDTTLATSAEMNLPQRIADHKHILLNGALYLTFSPGGSTHLFLLKTDLAGARQGNLVTVVSDSPVVTNDMHLFTDGTYVYASTGSGNPRDHKRVYKYDQSLNLVAPSPYLLPSGADYQPLGSTFYRNATFFVFAGDLTNHNLIVAPWAAWDSATPPTQRIIVPSVNGEWNWFATGSVFDPVNRRWYVGYAHMNQGEQADTQQTVDLAVFDEDFTLRQHLRVTPATGYGRPHFALMNGYLYLVYDGGFNVYLEKYRILPRAE